MSEQLENANIDQNAETAEGVSNEERRQALKKLGRYAAFTAPLMVGLLTTSNLAHASEPG